MNSPAKIRLFHPICPNSVRLLQLSSVALQFNGYGPALAPHFRLIRARVPPTTPLHSTRRRPADISSCRPAPAAVPGMMNSCFPNDAVLQLIRLIRSGDSGNEAVLAERSAETAGRRANQTLVPSALHVTFLPVWQSTSSHSVIRARAPRDKGHPHPLHSVQTAMLLSRNMSRVCRHVKGTRNNGTASVAISHHDAG